MLHARISSSSSLSLLLLLLAESALPECILPLCEEEEEVAEEPWKKKVGQYVAQLLSIALAAVVT
jgi:hypothetical protein